MRHTTPPLALLLLGTLGHAGAQTLPILSPRKAPAPLTLARALTHLPPPPKGVRLTVGADKITLPAGAAPPPADATLTVLANTFGEETQDFGSVVALAPATRVLLNAAPGPPDMPADLFPDTAFKMLAAGLDDAQWKMLTSEAGLGRTDLTDDTQEKFFQALFPQGQLWVASQDPQQAKLPDARRTDTRNVSDQIDGVRVRLGQSAQMYLSDRKGRTIYFSGPPANISHPHTWQPKDASAARIPAASRAVAPNTPKPGDLPLGDAKFRQVVSLSGAKTVEDLVAQVAAKTHTELYADPHYASRTLTIIGPAHEAPAADVLGALALAVAGTYRQVGPAFVLTDDLQGVGTRRRRLASWSHRANFENRKLQDYASLSLRENRAAQARSLSGFGDPLAITPGQMKSIRDDSLLPGVPAREAEFRRADLTLGQQSQAQKIADAYEDFRAGGGAGNSADPPQEPDPTGRVLFSPQYKVQLLIPTVQEPVETDLRDDVSGLFSLSNAVPDPRSVEEEKIALAKLPPAPPLLPLLRSRARRAIVGHPTTPDAVDALIAAMQKIGLNELWLDVFSGGKSRLEKDTDILTEALAKTQGKGIAVYADLSLLSWGYAPPKETWDLDILGENNHLLVSYDGEGLPYPAVPPPVSVSPVSASVKKTLTELMRGLAARPGLAGFLWEDTARGEDLGYVLAMRLAFLRAFHADPVDITDTWYHDDLSLPTFDDSTAEAALTKQWKEARLGANALLLTDLRQVVPAAAAKPILMEERTDDLPRRLMTWDDPHQMPPPLRTPSGSVGTARQSRSVLLRVTVTDAADTDALARALQAALPPPAAKANAAENGYVLYFSDPRATDSAEPLHDLVRTVTPKP